MKLFFIKKDFLETLLKLYGIYFQQLSRTHQKLISMSYMLYVCTSTEKYKYFNFWCRLRFHIEGETLEDKRIAVNVKLFLKRYLEYFHYE